MDTRTQCRNTIIGIAFVGLLGATGLVGCEKEQPIRDVKKEAPAQAPASVTESSRSSEAMRKESGAEAAVALMAPEGSTGRTLNDEGVNHAQRGHWDVAEFYFLKAIAADPKLAEAQFNHGLTLAKLHKYDEATIAFKKAIKLAPGNRTITESPILKKHTSA